MKIAIQGNPGSFHHIVASRWYGPDCDILYKATFEAVFASLRAAEADAAVVAVENSLYGQFPEVQKLVQDNAFPVIGEVNEHIHQNLIVLPGTTLPDIRRVYSQYMALAQCRQFLDSTLPEAKQIEYADTAAAVAFIKELQDPCAAAIASSLSAEIHGMHVLQPAIEDSKDNYTRFLILQQESDRPV